MEPEPSSSYSEMHIRNGTVDCVIPLDRPLTNVEFAAYHQLPCKEKIVIYLKRKPVQAFLIGSTFVWMITLLGIGNSCDHIYDSPCNKLAKNVAVFGIAALITGAFLGHCCCPTRCNSD